MGNRATITIRHDRHGLSEPVQLYVHWFNHDQFRRILSKAIRSGVRADCLASAIVAEYVQEDRKANDKTFPQGKPSFTTVRIESTATVHSDIDVPPIEIVATVAETIVTHASNPQEPEIFPQCRP